MYVVQEDSQFQLQLPSQLMQMTTSMCGSVIMHNCQTIHDAHKPPRALQFDAVCVCCHQLAHRTHNLHMPALYLASGLRIDNCPKM